MDSTGKAGNSDNPTDNAGLALRDQAHPAVRQAADQLGSPAALDEFFRAAWRIVPDPDYVEFISSPARQLALFSERGYLSGDCDDAATLAASILPPVAGRAFWLPSGYQAIANFPTSLPALLK